MPHAEAWLAKWDRWLFDELGLRRAIARAPRLVLELLEAAYLSVYVLIPLGFAIVWFGAPDLDVRRYWTVVVSAELICYAMLPWIRTRPPRSLGDHLDIDMRPIVLRGINLRVLHRGSIHANTVPSGHAAGALATALMVMEYNLIAGTALLALAFAIMAGSVVGRYHYAMDSVLGALVAVIVWAVVRSAEL
jgi:membrane-associated phospholipid phosphatase